MSEENTAVEPENKGAGAGDAEKTFTQQQVDEIVKQRLARAKHDKPADYDELKAKAEELDEIKNKSESDLEKLQGRIDKLEGENKAMKHAAELASWRDEVAKETGVPASVLRGDSLDELKAHAEAIKEAMPSYPSVDPGKPANAKLTSEQVSKIKDPVERIKARAWLIEQDTQ